MRYLVGVTMLMSLGGFTSTATANNHCSTDMYQRADASLVRAARGWRSLLRHQRAFGFCDDGALAEGYSDAVVTLLAHRWDQFHEFVGLSERDPPFRRWAIRHIDASASTADLTKVLRYAAKCTGSAKAKDLCREIARAATDALKDTADALKDTAAPASASTDCPQLATSTASQALDRRVETGDRQAALCLAVGLHSLDGGELEDALVALGRYGDQRPTELLGLTNQGLISKRSLANAVTMLPLSLSDDPDAQATAMEARRDRYRKVVQPALSAERELALRSIKTALASIRAQ